MRSKPSPPPPAWPLPPPPFPPPPFLGWKGDFLGKVQRDPFRAWGGELRAPPGIFWGVILIYLGLFWFIFYFKMLWGVFFFFWCFLDFFCYFLNIFVSIFVYYSYIFWEVCTFWTWFGIFGYFCVFLCILLYFCGIFVYFLFLCFTKNVLGHFEIFLSILKYFKNILGVCFVLFLFWGYFGVKRWEFGDRILGIRCETLGIELLEFRRFFRNFWHRFRDFSHPKIRFSPWNSRFFSLGVTRSRGESLHSLIF